ncbi:MAG: DUF4349 domain-containing protein [Mucilaginibacter sp.]
MKTKILMMLSAMVLLAACKGSSSSYESMSGTADSVKMQDVNLDVPKLIKTGGMNFKVNNVQQASEKITSLTGQYNGMVMSHRVNSTVNSTSDKRVSNDSVMRVSAFYTSANMTVKVPSIKLDEYLDKVSSMGLYVTSRSMDIEDKTLDYLSARLKLNSRKEMVTQQKAGKIIIKNPSAVLNLKDDLVDEQISNRKIDEAVKYSVVNLSFYQSNTIFKEVIADDDPAAYNLPFFKRIGVALGYGWHIFIEAIIMLANIWVFVILIIAGVLFVRTNKRNKLLTAGSIKN